MRPISRETEALLQIAEFRYLTRSLVEAFLLDDDQRVKPVSRKKVCLRVLSRLRAEGLIATTGRVVGGFGGGSSPSAYRLTAKGVAAARVLNPGLPHRRPAEGGTFLMQHGLMTAEVALAFRRAARTHPGHALDEWACDWAVAEKLGSSFVVPDASFVYRTGTWTVDVFLEVDLGTEGTRFFTRKIGRYFDLYREGSWRSHLLIWPIILTVTHTEARAAALYKAIEVFLAERRGAGWRDPGAACGFAGIEALRGPGPLAPVWWITGRSGPQSLLRDAPPAAADPLPDVPAPPATPGLG